MEPVNPLLKQAEQGNRFRPGVSGNPKGRPRKYPNPINAIIQGKLDASAEPLIDAVIDKARKGDVAALRLCLDRLISPVKERPINVDIPAAANALEILRAMEAVFEAITSGGLTPGEGQSLAGLLDSQRKIIETAAFETRLAAVESELAKKGDTPKRTVTWRNQEEKP